MTKIITTRKLFCLYKYEFVSFCVFITQKMGTRPTDILNVALVVIGARPRGKGTTRAKVGRYDY